MTDDATIKVKDLRVGDHVSYRDVENEIVQSKVRSLVRGKDARLVGFYPTKTNELEPRVAISVDRIVKAWRENVPTPTTPPGRADTTSDLLKALEHAAIVVEGPTPPVSQPKPEPSYNPYDRGTPKPGPRE